MGPQSAEDTEQATSGDVPIQLLHDNSMWVILAKWRSQSLPYAPPKFQRDRSVTIGSKRPELQASSGSNLLSMKDMAEKIVLDCNREDSY